MDPISHFFQEFYSLLFQVAPYFLLGVLGSAALATYLDADFTLKYLNKGMGPIVNAAFLGAVLPGCACATMPMAHAIKSRGANPATVSTFIFVSPLLSPQTVALTYGMLGMKFTLARIIFSLAGAITLGFFFNYLGFSFQSAPSCGVTADPHRHSFWKNFVQIMLELGKYFLVGIAIASLMLVLVPQDMIPKYIGSSGPWAYVMAAVMGIPVYICEGEEIPLTAALLKLGLGAGPAMTFLLGAVGTCIPTMLMAQKIIGKKPTMIYILFWIVFAIGAGLLFSVV